MGDRGAEREGEEERGKERETMSSGCPMRSAAEATRNDHALNRESSAKGSAKKREVQREAE